MATIYSHSQIQSYQKCPLRYRFEKIDAIPVPKVAAIPLSLGTAVHSALETLYGYRRNLVVSSKDELLKRFDDAWIQEIELADQKAAAEQLDYAFSQEDREQAVVRGRQYLQWYYDTYYPFDQAITDSVEKNIIVELAPDVKLKGKIDRFDIKGDTAIVVDYKTSRSMPKDKDDTIKDQLALYGAAIMQEYSDKFTKVLGKVVYVHLEREYDFEITQEVVEALKQKYIAVIQEIEAKRFAFNLWDQQAFPAMPWYHCDTCPFKRLCPIYAHQYMDNETMSVVELGETTIRDMIDKVYLLAQQSKAINDKKDFYIDLLREYATQKWFLQKLRWHTAKLKVEKKDVYEPEKETLDQLVVKLEEIGQWDAVKKEDIDKKKLDGLLQNGTINPKDLWWLVVRKERTTVWRPQNIKDKEMEEAASEIGI